MIKKFSGISRRSEEDKILYNVWRKMIAKCYNEQVKEYAKFGARGIRVYNDWVDGINGLENFIVWSKNNGYKKGLTLIHINKDKDYTPTNCKWGTTQEQSEHKRSTIMVEINGTVKSVSSWAKESNLNRHTIIYRLNIGKTGDGVIEGRQNIKDLSGMEFGRLKVIREIGRTDGRAVIWECVCSCDNKTVTKVSSNCLLSGSTSSCGCLQKELLSKRAYKHGKSNSRLYSIYRHMIIRCYDNKFIEYHNYGGRGITVCGEWLNVIDGIDNFFNWALNNGYDEKLSIDRINVNGNYEPSNCRWATAKEQANNKRNTILINIGGISKTAEEWAKETTVSAATIRVRFKKGLSENELLKPSQKRRPKNENEKNKM